MPQLVPNLLDSTDLATIFLDSTLRVRRDTSKATRLVRLLPTDVDRPLSDRNATSTPTRLRP